METSPPAWVRDAIAYQIFPDRFARSPRVHKPGPLEPWDAPATVHGFKGGDLLGVVEHLDHLERLGITAISLNPIFSSAANHRYHTYDYERVVPLLGGDDALRELVDAAHGRGMRVILDGVFNHASRGFWPFNHVMENGRSSPYVDWFHLNPEWLKEGRQLRAFDEHAHPAEIDSAWVREHAPGTASLETLGYRAWWDLPALPKLNTDNPEVREYLYGIAEHWIALGADGWRLDVAEEITTPGFWEEFRRRVRAVNPEAYILAEIWEQRPELLDGRTYDALMNYPFLYAVVGYAAGEHLDRRVVDQHGTLGRRTKMLDGEQLARQLEHLVAAYRRETTEAMLNLVDGHDTPRLRTMTGGDRAAVRLATLVQMTFPGAPCIYYGTEVGLEGEMDPACRGGFPWREDAWDADLLAYVRAASALRHATPVLRRGSFRIAGAAGPALAYLRHWTDEPMADRGGPEAVLVALNNAETPARLTVEVPELAGRTLRGAGPATAGGGEISVEGGGAAVVELPARSGRVLVPA